MRSERRGFALVGVLLAIVCVSAILAGAAFVARQDHMLSSVSRQSQRAFAAAELAAWSAVASLDSGALGAPRGEERTAPVAVSGVDIVRAATVRLSPEVLVAVGEAGIRPTDDDALLWRRVAVFVYVRRDSAGVVTFAPLPQRAWAELQ